MIAEYYEVCQCHAQQKVRRAGLKLAIKKQEKNIVEQLKKFKMAAPQEEDLKVVQGTAVFHFIVFSSVTRFSFFQGGKCFYLKFTRPILQSPAAETPPMTLLLSHTTPHIQETS